MQDSFSLDSRHHGAGDDGLLVTASVPNRNAGVSDDVAAYCHWVSSFAWALLGGECRQMTDKLLPCPFCGGDAQVKHDTSSDYKRHWRWLVECLDYENCALELNGFSTREQAISRWNSRKSSAYSHRNGETDAPTIPGTYWFKGTVNWWYRGALTTTNSDCTAAWDDTTNHPSFLDISCHLGQWWGPIAAPWEGENVNL